MGSLQAAWVVNLIDSLRAPITKLHRMFLWLSSHGFEGYGHLGVACGYGVAGWGTSGW